MGIAVFSVLRLFNSLCRIFRGGFFLSICSFLGRLTPEEMKAVYSRSVLVFPSYLETVGLPLLEAKALSRPIIAADLEYARESVGDYDEVHYFSALDYDALAVAIEEAFK